MTYLAVTRSGLRTSNVDNADVGVMRHRSATLLAWSGPVLVVAAYLQLAGRLARADPATSFAHALIPARMWHFLSEPANPGSWVSSGALILSQNILFVVVGALLAALFIPAGRDHLDRVATIAAPITVTALVVNSLPTYVGGLASLVLLGRTRRVLGKHAALLWTRIWQRPTRPGMSGTDSP